MSAATVTLKSLYWTPALKVSIPFPRSAISREPISLRSYLMLRAVIRRLKQPRAYKSAFSAAGSRKSKGRKTALPPPTGDAGATASMVRGRPHQQRSEEHTSELQSLMRISYAVFCLKKKIKIMTHIAEHDIT